MTLRELVDDHRHGTFTDGPWTAALWFTVPGRVHSKSNHRHGNGNWADLVAYEDEVAMTSRAARPSAWPEVDDVSPRPVVVAVLVARTGVDAGNLSKSILDACQNVLYVDDRQVTGLSDLVEPTRTGQGLLAAFAALSPDATVTDAASAQATLMGRVRDLLDQPAS